MIRNDEIVEIGTVNKTHGIKGELSVTFDFDEVDPGDLRCLVFDMDGINVPYFVTSARRCGNSSWLILIDGVTTDTEASPFVGKSVSALRTDLPDSDEEDEDGFYVDDLIGFELFDTDNSHVGHIVDYDDSTINTLFEVERPDGTKLFVPAAADLIAAIDADNHTVTIDLPTGLV